MKADYPSAVDADRERAVSKFYPDAWMFEADARLPGKPRYLVQCDTLAEQRLAAAVKPPYVDATIVLRDSQAPGVSL